MTIFHLWTCRLKTVQWKIFVSFGHHCNLVSHQRVGATLPARCNKIAAKGSESNNLFAIWEAMWWKKGKEVICTMQDVFANQPPRHLTVCFSFSGCQLVKVSHTHFQSQSLFTWCACRETEYMCVCVYVCAHTLGATSGASSFYMFGTPLSHLRLRSTPRGSFDAVLLFTVIPC